MKKFLAGLLTIVSLFALVCLASCDDTKDRVSLTSDAKVIRNDETTFAFTASADADGTKFVYDYLVSFQEDGVMTFSGSETQYGFSPEVINGRKLDSSKNEYWGVFTSVTVVDGVIYSSTEYISYEINGMKLGYANYGVSSLPVFAGETYVLTLSSYTKDPGSLTSDAKVIKNDETTFAFTASAEADGTKFVYDYLVSFQEDGIMTFSGRTDKYGYFIESVNGTTADSGKNEFWAVYTSVTTVDGVVYSSTEYGTYEIEGNKLGSASYGVSSLPVFAGETYVLTLSSY